jgi:hypothetical protein
VKIYLGYTLANALSTLGGKAWVVEERLYPTACVALCATVVIVTLVARQRQQLIAIGEEGRAKWSLD